MNSTPAISRARRTARSLAAVIDVSPSDNSARRMVVAPIADSCARSGAKREPVLAAWGFTAEGRRVLLHLMAGSKEDTETVTAFFEDMKRRGLNDPLRVTLKRFQACGLSWPLPEELTDVALEARLFGPAGTKQGHRRQAEPDWTATHRELKRKHVTLSVLWDEYIEQNPQG
jgi:Transposase, Mutator family